MIDSLRMEFNDEPTKNFFLSTKESLIIYGNNQRQKNRFKFNKKLFKPNKKH